jgi:serine/threonine protein kinase
MSPENSDPPPKRFFGLNPSKLLTVLDAGHETVPMIPGWTITGIAGRGGFGTVWRAKRETDGVEAAIKIAPADDPDTLERIEDEIGALRTLNHPHIVALLESGPLDDSHDGLFLAMEFIDGMELSQEIPPGGLPPETAYTLFREMSSAVAHAHDAGILHRDLKPANILLDSGGHAKVADFGLALPVHRRVQQLSLTRAGMIAGTAEYLPPEAYRQDYQPSPTTDVFALGVILHEMLAGTPPRGAWPPVSNSRRVDVRMDVLIRRALEPDPRERWQSVSEMRAALEEITHSPPRYAGTPLVTFPICFADFLWTLIGIYTFIASLSSLLHLRKSSLSLPFDLIGTHSSLIGGFQAFFVLVQAAFALGVWQLLRLWRFRNVPMREALPSPFGLRLGRGKVAAALVILCQIFCLWLPAIHIVTIFFDSCVTWLSPGDPAWRAGLTVVCWKDGSMVSPWTYPEVGRGFWLQDRYGPPGHPLSRKIDQIGFTPLLFPLMMSVAAVTLLVSLIFTLLVTARTRWLRGHRMPVLLLGLASICAASLIAKPTGDLFYPRSLAEVRREKGNSWISAQMTNHVREIAFYLLGSPPESLLLPSRSDWMSYYHETVNYRNHGAVPRGKIEGLRQEDKIHAYQIHSDLIFTRCDWDAQTGRFIVTASALETCDGKQPGRTTEAAECVLTLSGTITRDGRTTIDREKFRRKMLYQISLRHASQAEALAWTQQLKQTVRLASSSPDAPDSAMADLFHPLQFTIKPRDERWLRSTPAPDGGLVAMLSRLLSPESPMDVSISENLPGGRTRVVARLTSSRPDLPKWLTFDLIHHAGVFKCVRLDTSKGG